MLLGATWYIPENLKHQHGMGSCKIVMWNWNYKIIGSQLSASKCSSRSTHCCAMPRDCPGERHVRSLGGVPDHKHELDLSLHEIHDRTHRPGASPLHHVGRGNFVSHHSNTLPQNGSAMQVCKLSSPMVETQQTSGRRKFPSSRPTTWAPGRVHQHTTSLGRTNAKYAGAK